MIEGIIVAGNDNFQRELSLQLSSYHVDELIHPNNQLFASQALVSKTDKRTNLVLAESHPLWFPTAESALKHGQHLVLFGLYDCDLEQLNHLLQLAVESNCVLLNGDALMFNPVIYPMIHNFEHAQVVTLSSNQFRRDIMWADLMRSVEFLLFTNKSSLKKCHAKGVQLEQNRLNMVHIRFEFENENIAVLEITNNKPTARLLCETVGQGSWLSLDLLSLNGQYHYFSDLDDKWKTPKQVYPEDRNSVSYLMDYLKEQISNDINSYEQFDNFIRTREALTEIELQLRRSLPNFGHFEY